MCHEARCVGHVGHVGWDLVTRVIIRVTILITPMKVLITLLTKSHDPPSRDFYSGDYYDGLGKYSPYRYLPCSGFERVGRSEWLKSHLGF